MIKRRDIKKLLRNKKVAYPAYFVILVIIVALSYANGPGIKNSLTSLKITPKPKPVTEFYFTDDTHLPTTYTPGQMQNVAFTVRDLEGKTVKYEFKVVEISGKTGLVLADNTFSLKQGQRGNLKVPVKPVDMGSKVRISVELNSQSNSIGYEVTKK